MIVCDRSARSRALAVNPYRVGKPLFGPLAGCHGARRGTYRIVYRIDESTRTVHLIDIDHRVDVYRPRDLTAATQWSGQRAAADQSRRSRRILTMNVADGTTLPVA